jgi:hypothetical protein
MSRVSIIEVTKALKGMHFPAEKDDLLQYAQDHGASQPVVEFMQEMPEDEYDSMADVMHAFGEANEKDEG